MSVHILGIRHHGPGSARNVKSFLEKIKPDIILVEGPPEADPILQWVGHAEMKPPVAILVYRPDSPQQSSFYPFAEFSPEWQAILYARQQHIHVRFMDLPIANQMAIKEESKIAVDKKEAVDSDDNHIENNSNPPDAVEIRTDPISFLAEAAGYNDGEQWWEHMFEYRYDNEDVFDAVAEAMKALRESIPEKYNRVEHLREAHMRKTIREAEKEMFQNIAVVCGAWHAPALLSMPKQKEDNELLKGLPKVKVECTWVPWTYNRLSYFTGYGAGIASPGWYEHVWKYPEENGVRWLANVAKLFRNQQMDISVAHVIEAVRLAEALASLRHLSKAGLEELNEATLSVLCNGESILMQLIHKELIVSDKIGEVPVEIPKPPLQVDIEKQQKKLRLPATADFKDYTLDLRKENDLERSVFLHRLQLLEIPWGAKSNISGKGTFKEQWRLQWDPAFSVDIIERGSQGNTVEEAATFYISQQALEATELAAVCDLLENALPAEIPKAVEILIGQINNLAAGTGDVVQLMQVIPPLVAVSRYGNVRKTDADLVLGIAQSMIVRICVSLPAACTGINEEASQQLLELFYKMNDAVNLLQQQEISEMWQQTLLNIARNRNSAFLIAGYSTRLLTDYKLIAGEDLMKAFNYAMSVITAPPEMAAWLEGFLKGSGTILLLDKTLWELVDNWVAGLDNNSFIQLLPLLRRTFSHFTNTERRKLGEKVRSGNDGSKPLLQEREINFNIERARLGIPVILQLLGIQKPTTHE